MTVNFNPNISNKKHNPPKMVNRNPNVAFKRNFTAQEIEGITKGKDNVLNNVIVAIRIGLIKAQDGAKETLQGLIKQNPEKPYLNVVLSKFP